ncbi:hypothetical protein [Amycolatopsis sp. cmx-8-4]
MTRVIGSGGAGRTDAALSTMDTEGAWQRHAAWGTPNGAPPAHRVRE